MNQLVCLAWVLLFISCSPGREQVHVLRIYDPSNDSQKWGKVCEDNNFLIDHRTDFSFLAEDSLDQISAIILDQVDLDPLNHYQANALKRYLQAGGGLLPIQAKASVSSQHKWPWLYQFIQKSSSGIRVNHSESFGISPLQNGRMVQPYSHSSSSEEMLSALKAAIGSNPMLNYDEVMEETSPPEHWFEIQGLASNFNEPQEMEVLPNGDVLFIERGGDVQLYEAVKKKVQLAAHIPVWSSQSNGLTGMALAPDFEESSWVYFLFAGKEDSTHLQVARFQLEQDQLDLESKQLIFEIPVPLRLGWHGENSLAFDSKGNLYISLGDFTLQSRDIAGYAQIDERPGKAVHDAQRTSANSNSYLGKILRIHPEPEGGYTIPEGNLFPPADSLGKAEIYVMGCRNPYRFSIDPRSDILYVGEVGPDAKSDHEKGPRGYDEINVVREAGFYGWPYFVADNKPYFDFDYASHQVGKAFDPQRPLNHSPNNTGIQDLPPAKPAALWYEKSASERFPYMNVGGMNIMGGPIYHADLFPPTQEKLPAYYSGKMFIYDWVRNWIRTIEFDENDEVLTIEPFLDSRQFNKIIDMELGPDGSLYILEYGQLGYRQNADAALRRIVYKKDNPKPLLADKEEARPTVVLPPISGYEKGKELIEAHNCLSCHRAQGQLIGPGFRDIALRYGNEDFVVDSLPNRIKNGSSGNWGGNVIMPAHPNLTEAETNQIVAYILSLRFLSE